MLLALDRGFGSWLLLALGLARQRPDAVARRVDKPFFFALGLAPQRASTMARRVDGSFFSRSPGSNVAF